MKYLFLTTIAALLCSAVVSAQNPVHFTAVPNVTARAIQAQSNERKTFAQFKFSEQERTHDFGTIPEGPKVTHAFTFLNTGNEPLIISNAQASCGCTSPEFSKDPVLPGQKGTITVTYATEGRPGSFTKSVYLTSNARTENGAERYELFIKGNVLPAKK
jgi:hypothetical protein